MDFSCVDAVAFGAPVVTGLLRVENADFRVDEQLGFVPEGEGEQVFLQLRKDGANTQWVAEQLAKHYACRPQAVAFSGLKDRHAITTQWFSVHLPGKQMPGAPEIEGCEVLQLLRGKKKLRRGVHKQNHFCLRLREVEGDWLAIQARLAQIRSAGFPNYFGPQRFGREQGNLAAAERWFSGQFRPKARNKKSLYLSAARAWLFNRQLSSRVAAGDWLALSVGARAGLEGSGAHFVVDDVDEALVARLEAGDIHPLGALWGQGAEVDASLEPWQRLCEGLLSEGLKLEWRPLRAMAHELSAHWCAEQRCLELSFRLNRGSYATSLLAALGDFRELPRAAQAPPAVAQNPQ